MRQYLLCAALVTMVGSAVYLSARDSSDATDSPFIYPNTNFPRTGSRRPPPSTINPNAPEQDSVQTVYGIQRDYRRGYADWGGNQLQTIDDLNLADRVRRNLMYDRYLWKQAQNIQIQSSGQTITLVGNVNSLSVSRKIEAIAQQTNGVVDVDNQLTTGQTPRQ